MILFLAMFPTPSKNMNCNYTEAKHSGSGGF